MSLYAGNARERIIQLDSADVVLPPRRNQRPHLTLSPRTAQGLPTQGMALTLIEARLGAALGIGGVAGVSRGHFVISTCPGSGIYPDFIGRTVSPAVAPTSGFAPVDVSVILGLAAGAGAVEGPPCELRGGSVSGTLADYTSITDGGFDFGWGGHNQQMSGIDLSGAASMSEVAALIETKLGDLDVVVSVTWVEDVIEIGGSGGEVGGGFNVTMYRAVPSYGGWAELAPFATQAHYGEQYVLPDLPGGWGLYFQVTGVIRPGRLLLAVAETD